MAYEWPVDPQDLFSERYPQMINTGLPAEDADAMRGAIIEMWPDAPGGWVYEWSQLASGYAAIGRHDLAMLAYGWAKFPALANATKRVALDRQLEQYLLAAPGFGVSFERRLLTLPYRGGTTPVPVHVFAAPDLRDDAPVVIASGGVDSWKMDLHTMFLLTALHAGVRVMAFDIPGTGESAIPMSAGAVEVIDGLIAEARCLGRKVGHLGISMGGYFSARSGLAGLVDAAFDLGGPVEHAFAGGKTFQFGMADILGNALGFDRPPTPDEMADPWQAFSLRPLLDQDINAPMLVINGADDVHIPQRDTLVFEGRRDTRVELIPGTGHCAASKVPEVLSTMIPWIASTLGT